MGFLPPLSFFIGFFPPPVLFRLLFCWIEHNFLACIFKGRRGQKARKMVAEGKVGVEEEEEVGVADMLIVRDKHFSAVVIRGEAVTSLAC